MTSSFDAQIDPLLEMRHDSSTPSHWRDLLIILGIALVLVALFFIWAVYIRKRKRRVSRSLSRELPHPIPRPPRERRRKRRRRWKNRNPTLEQTGGLPAEKIEPASPDAG